MSLACRLVFPLQLLLPGGPSEDVFKQQRDASLGALCKLVLEACWGYYSRMYKHVQVRVYASD